MKHIIVSRRGEPGFSLIEVMIAVVVLATGLLALAALQGNLTRSSAEAKVRGRVAALLSAHMDELRANQYDSAETLGDDGCTTDLGAEDWVPASFCQEAGIGALTATQEVHVWSSEIDEDDFEEDRDPTAGLNEPEFKRVELGATWTDATGSSHSLHMTSQLSALALKDSLLPAPPVSGTPTGHATVRQDNPEGNGVIPIALGNGDSSAASNPTPELVGKNTNNTLVGTKFNVLTYTPDGTAATIQKRFENDVIKCTCQYGAGDSLAVIYQAAQWPAVWNGDEYEVYSPDSGAAAPGETFNSGPKSGVEQSPMCQECCRDHHDTTDTTVARFDPERSDGLVSKFVPNGSGALVQVTTSSEDKTYIDSCRVIRVDGFWRTASDMYSRQYGLLETETVGDKKAKTGLPTDAATTAYTGFVKSYLKQYTGSVGTAPSGAQGLYDGTTGLNAPDVVTISTPSNSDYRYLHARGLYVDYLEEKAKAKLVSVLADNTAQGRCPDGTPVEDCILPYLPFTTINLTELATWAASDTNVLTVNSQNQLASNPSEPSGGKTSGISVGEADNQSSIRKSNSGVAASTVIAGGVDPKDASVLGTDTQKFSVGGTASTGDHFDVRITGGGTNPFVFYSIATDTGECVKPAGGDHRCATNTTLAGIGGSVRLEHYWAETTTLKSITGMCTNNKNVLESVTATVDVPTFHNYVITSASIGGVNGTIAASVNDNKTTETTSIAFANIIANSLALVTLGEQTGSPVYATVATCTTNGSGNMRNITWTKSWELP